MQARRFRGLPTATVLGFTVPVATHRRARTLGLALLDRECAGEGLLIPKCAAVHTFGMRFALDLVFLDQDGVVVELRRDVAGRSFVRAPNADSVLELPSPGEKSRRRPLISSCFPRSKSWRRWSCARTTTPPASCSAIT